MPDGCTLVILAGGASRRMGRDKAALSAGQTTIVERLAGRLAGVVDEVVVAGGSQPISQARLVTDRYPGQGPLAGMQAGLEAARHPWAWVVACDLPDVEPGIVGLLTALSGGADAVVPVAGGEVQSLCALYRRDLHSPIADLLRHQVRSVRAFLDEISVRYVGESEVRAVDPELRSFRNLNTAADYEAWLKTR